MILIRKVFYIVLAVSALLTGLSALLYVQIGGGALEAIFVTFATTLYHFAMRLAVGFSVRGLFPKKIDHGNAWFREHRWEKKLYKRLRVRRWARKIPTFNPEEFDPRLHDTAALVRQTCLSEMVHEVIVAAGFLSVPFCFFFDDPFSNLWPFLITAILAGAYDMRFVILQRYHRPMLLRHMERTERKAHKACTNP